MIAPFMVLLTAIIPKKRGRVVFFSPHEKGRFAGNLRPIFIKLSSSHTEDDCIWITKRKETYQKLLSKGLKAKLYRVFPIWTVARAEWIFIDSFSRALCFGRLNIVQIWHGTGFKKIGLQNDRNTKFDFWLTRRQSKKYRLIPCLSSEDVRVKREIFVEGNFVVTGSPRNDILLDSGEQTFQLRKKICGGESSKIVLYAPTFRDSGGASLLDNQFWAQIQEWAELSDAKMLIKKHPLDYRLNVPTGYDRIRDITNEGADIQSVLTIADVLITDYSSISVDYVILERPIIFFIYDIAQYMKNSRGFIYNLEELLPGPFAFDSKGLLHKLRDFSWFFKPEFVEKRSKFKDMFHQFTDANSTVRVISEFSTVRDRIRGNKIRP